MQRLIDAQDTFNVLSDYYHHSTHVQHLALQEALNKVPTAQPKRGKWEMKPDPFGFFDEILVCSECGCTTKMREKTLYCPHCGARMDERKEE